MFIRSWVAVSNYLHSANLTGDWGSEGLPATQCPDFTTSEAGSTKVIEDGYGGTGRGPPCIARRRLPNHIRPLKHACWIRTARFLCPFWPSPPGSQIPNSRSMQVTDCQAKRGFFGEVGQPATRCSAVCQNHDWVGWEVGQPSGQ